jgi:hypothetical protein
MHISALPAILRTKQTYFFDEIWGGRSLYSDFIKDAKKRFFTKEAPGTGGGTRERRAELAKLRNKAPSPKNKLVMTHES